MKPSSAPKKISAAKARNALLLNLLGTPGLGTLLAGRWVAGLGQLLIFLAGFVLFSIWAFTAIIRYYGMMFNAAAPGSIAWNHTATAGLVLCFFSWVWSLVTSLTLLREASQVRRKSLEYFGAGQMKLGEEKIPGALAALPGWKRSGDVISRTFQFKDFPVAMKFVNAVAELAEQAQHHPDMDIRWNKVTLAFTTHDAGGLTQKDFALAGECDALAL